MYASIVPLLDIVYEKLYRYILSKVKCLLRVSDQNAVSNRYWHLYLLLSKNHDILILHSQWRTKGIWIIPFIQFHPIYLSSSCSLGWGIILYGHKIIEMEGMHIFMKQLLFHYFVHLHHHHHYCLHYLSIGSIYPDILAHDNKGPPLYFILSWW